MVDFIRNDVADINDEGQVADYLRKIIQKEGGDRSGLIYGMGHAVYTISDPRAKILREQAAIAQAPSLRRNSTCSIVLRS